MPVATPGTVKWEDLARGDAGGRLLSLGIDKLADASCPKCRVSYLWKGKPSLVECPRCGLLINSAGKGGRRSYKWLVLDSAPAAPKPPIIKAATKKPEAKPAATAKTPASKKAPVKKGLFGRKR